jgi:hypothetical protein
MKTDTPETDAETWKAGDLRIGSKVCADFARKLERERDELKRWTSVNGVIDLQRERDEAREVLKITQEAWVKAKAERVEALRERDEAREYADRLAEGLPDGMLPKDVEVLREANLGLATELAAVTAQRDMLAEALRKVARSWNYAEVAQQALQSLTHKP